MVDVLLATHRANREFLDAQIDSIRRQRGVEINLLVREDEAGEGAKANFSALLGLSRSPYAAFSDQDDVWHDDKLMRLMDEMARLEALHGASSPILVFCDSFVVDSALNPFPGTFISRQRVDVARGLAPQRLAMQNFIAGNLMLFNAALRDLAFPVPADAMMHDIWLALVAAAFGHIKFLPVPLLEYRQHSSNALGADAADAAHFLRRLREGVAEFRRRLDENIAQAAAFAERFGDKTPAAIRALAAFPTMSWTARRVAMHRHALRRHGLARNIALELFA